MVRTDRSRMLWWVVDHFRVLPTDPRFRALTPELTLWLFASHHMALKEAAETAEQGLAGEPRADPEFDQWERGLDAEEGLRLDLDDDSQWRDIDA